MFYLLKANQSAPHPLPQPLTHNGKCTKVTFKSATLDLKSDLNKGGSGGSAFNLLSASGDILLHITTRRHKDQVALNSQFGGRWGQEEIIPLNGLFTSSGPNAKITISAHAGGYLIKFDDNKGYFYNRRSNEPAVSISYGYSSPVFSDPIIVKCEYRKSACTCGALNSENQA